MDPDASGDEGVGVIETLGDKVSGFSKGQRVVGIAFGTGTWAQYITVPASKLASACLPMTCITAILNVLLTELCL